MSATMKKLILLVAASLMLSACSNQWREADPGVDGQFVMDQLTEIESTSASGRNAQVFRQIVDNPESAIYYADAPNGNFGPLHNVVSIFDYTFISPDIYFSDIESARVFFLDETTAEHGRRNALMLDLTMKESGRFVTETYTGTDAVIEDGQFIVTMVDDSGRDTLILSSYDVDDEGRLNGVIQLEVYDFDENGVSQYLGKISTLVGFQ